MTTKTPHDFRNKVAMNDSDLHEKFSHYGANAKEWIHKCKLLLPEIAKRQIWRKKKFGSIYEYAAKLAGMSRHSVDDALWTLRKIEGKPALLKIAEEKGVGRVRPIANIATEETAGFWAEKAREMSKNTLETYVKNYREDFCPRTKTQPGEIADEGISNKKASVTMELDKKLLDKLSKMKGDRDWNEFLEDLAENAEGEKPEPVRSESRYIPAKIKHHVLMKTGGRCAFPGCMREHASLHHTQRFAAERVHDPDRLVPLCQAHERIAHLGLIDGEEGPPSDWRLREEADPTDMKLYVDRFVGLYR